MRHIEPFSLFLRPFSTSLVFPNSLFFSLLPNQFLGLTLDYVDYYHDT